MPNELSYEEEIQLAKQQIDLHPENEDLRHEWDLYQTARDDKQRTRAIANLLMKGSQQSIKVTPKNQKLEDFERLVKQLHTAKKIFSELGYQKLCDGCHATILQAKIHDVTFLDDKLFVDEAKKLEAEIISFAENCTNRRSMAFLLEDFLYTFCVRYDKLGNYNNASNVIDISEKCIKQVELVMR